MKYSSLLAAALATLSAAAQTTHELVVEDDAFAPPSLTIQLGDHVHIIWDEDASTHHTFTQVDEATWDANGTLPLSGGFNLGEGTPTPGTDFTITPTADVWYVCQFHVDMGMKGVIDVQGQVGLDETDGPHALRFAPNPATRYTTVVAPEGWPITVRMLNSAGVAVGLQNLQGDRTLDIASLSPGIYLAEVWYTDGPLLGRKRLLVQR